jgi:hypothetical protein
MIKFKDFFKQKQPKKPKSEMKARHMHPIGLDPNSHPKHPGRFVPKMHQVKQENPKLTRMKSGQSKREVLASCDVKQIIRQFSISPDINNPKKLGNTGIVMRYDQRYKKFILESVHKSYGVDNDIENPFFQEGDYVEILINRDDLSLKTEEKIKKVIEAHFVYINDNMGIWEYKLEGYDHFWWFGNDLEEVDLKVKDENDKPTAANLLDI